MKASELIEKMIEELEDTVTEEDNISFYNKVFNSIEIEEEDYEYYIDVENEYYITPDMVIKKLVSLIADDGDFEVSSIRTDENGEVEVLECVEETIEDLEEEARNYALMKYYEDLSEKQVEEIIENYNYFEGTVSLEKCVDNLLNKNVYEEEDEEEDYYEDGEMISLFA